ncbi:MAG TPA: delta-60 repeat domain-containing protein, partial [Clostridia bacterium]|nr:delta-60 repeat domain-containing protein [Clostridia bacterium]
MDANGRIVSGKNGQQRSTSFKGNEKRISGLLSWPSRWMAGLTLLWGFLLVAHAQFPMPDDFSPDADHDAQVLAAQGDGKILLGGFFKMLGGQPRAYFGRLNPDGTLDAAFTPVADCAVEMGLVQDDGRIVIAGCFSSLNGQPRYHLGRLNPDGTLDTDFKADVNYSCFIYSLCMQDDGRILVGGDFHSLGGETRKCLGRLNADGTVDKGFTVSVEGSYPNSPVVDTLAVQPDGKILVGGRFSSLGGQPRCNLGRLNVDGSVDMTFAPEANDRVYGVTVQADGGILLRGAFTTVNGQMRKYLTRIHADGILDEKFDPASDGFLLSLALQSDGKILVAGDFTAIGGQLRRYFGRLNADGTLDSSFQPAEDQGIYSVVIQTDGKILLGGSFSTLGGLPRKRLARLNNTEPAVQNLSYSGETITWL